MKEIMSTLLDCGVSPNISGFGYILKCVELIRSYINENDRSSDFIPCIKVIYPKVAHTCDTTVSALERDIRHTILLMHSRNEEKFVELFGKYISPVSGIVPAKKFLCVLAYGKSI